MRIVLLTDHQLFIPTIAQWYIDEWGTYLGNTSLEEEAEKMRVYLHRNQLPLMVIALEDKEIIGVAQLKFYEMEIYPDKKHWLGGVYVAPSHRGRGVAGQIVETCMNKARTLEVETLYLQTEDKSGGLYRQLGWEPLEEVNYKGNDVLVMKKDL
jgi:N-acetylglutamate synthase-like GNAT family acetyltransferase